MNLHDRANDVFFRTYKHSPIIISHGEGAFLYDIGGRRYIDLIGGLAVNSLGHTHEGILRAIAEQSEKFIHLSNYFLSDAAVQLAESIKRHVGCRRIFFSNSGTEAIEGSLKIARLWGSRLGKDKMIGFSNAFHGRTYGALSLMDRVRYRAGFGPFLPNCFTLPFDDPVALSSTVDSTTAAVFLEFIQGEAGVIPASEEFVETLEKLRRRYGFLIVADEIQSGLGRTGRPFAFNHYNIAPDIIVVAKSLGGGLPLGAILGMDSVADVLDIGQHGSTFGGNPVACAAACVVMREIFESGLMENAGAVGAALMDGLIRLHGAYPGLVTAVRGRGLMIGIELSRSGQDVAAELAHEGVLANCTNQNVIRLLPPLVISSMQVDEALQVIDAVFARHT